MDFSGQYHIPISRQRTWEALNDPAVLQASITGCKQLEKVSDTQFNAVVTTRVGPISVTFRGEVKLSELDAPQGYTLTGQGQGGAAGFARMVARVTLESISDQETLLRYSAKAEIGGKLASVGSRLVQGVAQKTADDFFASFTNELTGQTKRPSDTAALEKPLAYQPAEFVKPSALGNGGLGALVPAWLVIFGSGLGAALGYCVALLR